MAELEIRTTGELMQNGEIVGHIAFAKPFVEREVAGMYWPDDHEDFGREWATEEDVTDLEDEIEELKDDLERERARVKRLERVVADLTAQLQAQAVGQ